MEAPGTAPGSETLIPCSFIAIAEASLGTANIGLWDERKKSGWVVLDMVPAEGIEPPTFGLQNRCSTAELSRPKKGVKA